MFLFPRNALRRGYSNASVVPSVCPCVQPCEHDRNYNISCILIKLATHFYYDKRMIPIDFQGQGSKVKVKVTVNKYGNNLENSVVTNRLMYLYQTWYTYCTWWEDEPYWFSRSGVKGQGQYGLILKILVNRIGGKAIIIETSNLPQMYPMGREWTLLIFKVKVQRSRSLWA